MSKRLRREFQAERELILHSHEAEEEDDYQRRLNRIFAPTVWSRLNKGFRIQDLRENYFNDVIQMFKVQTTLYNLKTSQI